MIGIEHAIEIELYGIGVEICSIMEFDAFAQIERIGLAVGRDRPGFGEARLHVEAAVLVMQQAVVDVAEQSEVADRHRLGGVERLQFRDVADDQNVIGRVGQRNAREPHCRNGGGSGQQRAA